MEMDELIRDQLLPKIRTIWEKYIGHVPDEEMITMDAEDGLKIIINVQIFYDTGGNIANGWNGYSKSLVLADAVSSTGVSELRSVLEEFMYNYRGYYYNREEFPQ